MKTPSGHKVSEETVGADTGRLSLSALAVKYLFYDILFTGIAKWQI